MINRKVLKKLDFLQLSLNHQPNPQNQVKFSTHANFVKPCYFYPKNFRILKIPTFYEKGALKMI